MNVKWLYSTVLLGALCVGVAVNSFYPAKAEEQSETYNLQGHRALYEVKLDKLTRDSSVAAVHGEMAVKLRNVCDGWEFGHKFSVQYQYSNGKNQTLSNTYDALEGKTGDTLQYRSQIVIDEGMPITWRGLVDRAEHKATFSQPEDLSFDLKEGFFLPMAHSVELVKRAKRGEKFFNSVLFDGSDIDGPVEVNSFIGKEVKISQEMLNNKKLSSDLLNTRAWNIRLAFFSLKHKSELPLYEMSLVLHENTMVSLAILEYPDFTIRQTLKALEVLPPTKC